ncbi:MAG: DASH family cryptochrome [Saprospiraceae bacterium]|nr:DASH family cryptochrome [Saprospiraceae bacterium]
MQNRAIIWFRNDLRIHDNEALTEALDKKAKIFPVYIFDERIFFGKTSFGFEKISSFRTRFIIESVMNLRDNLKSLGADLIVRTGKPEDILFEIAKNLKTSWVYCNRERTQEEVTVQDALEKKLWTIGQELRYTRGKMLYYTSDLPFPVTHTPDVFTQFRKEVEKIVPVREPLPVPENIPYDPGLVEPGDIPTISFFKKNLLKDEHPEVDSFRGGESAALKQLHYYLWESRNILSYVETRNDFIGWDYSSKFSPWLAAGCLSPKMIYSEIKKFEATFGESKSTYWMIFELLWRDFFRLMGKKYGNCIFKPGGLRNSPKADVDHQQWQKWVNCETGIDIVDACMNQLKQTGFLSNRGRQIAASYLVNDLNADWRIGAEYFESLLLDYDPCSNYGNWNYIAGVGNDPREDRYFNPETQAKKYDPEGKFVSCWKPGSAVSKKYLPQT